MGACAPSDDLAKRSRPIGAPGSRQGPPGASRYQASSQSGETRKYRICNEFGPWRLRGLPAGREGLAKSSERVPTRPATLWYRLRIIHEVATNILEHLGSHRGAQRAPRCPRKKMAIYSRSLIFLMLELRESSLNTKHWKSPYNLPAPSWYCSSWSGIAF